MSVEPSSADPSPGRHHSLEPRVNMERAAIVGFGLAGQGVARALLQRGYRPIVVDDRPSPVAQDIAAELGLSIVVPDEYERVTSIEAATVLIPAPGLPVTHWSLAVAAAAGIDVIGEFDLARIWDDRPMIAITGTNGKTTVTTGVVAALRRGGIATMAAGNTDVPLISAIDDPDMDWFVVEASSFRLGYSQRFQPRIATWLNVAPDHLDNHGTMEAYVDAKAAIWRDLGADDIAIANIDDPVVMAHVPSQSSVVTFGLSRGDWRIEHGHVVGPSGAVAAVVDLPRRQPHDLANAAAIAATAAAAGITTEAIGDCLVAFNGLPHRLEPIGVWHDIAWFNDSKATVPHATLAAMGGFDSVVLIAGGRNKGLDLRVLGDAVPPVRVVIATGDAADDIVAAFAPQRSRLDGIWTAGSMAEAVDLAVRHGRSGDAVVLSPACTSYDWYTSYEERGEDFMRLVRERHQ